MDRLIRIAPRLLAIAAILFVSAFALDAFTPEKPWLEAASEFAIHLLPSTVLLGVLLIAWRFERLGGALFILVSIAPLFLLSGMLVSKLIIGGPFLAVGLMFWFSYWWHLRHRTS